MTIQDTCVDHFSFLLISVCFKNGVDTAWFMLFAFMEFFAFILLCGLFLLMWSIFFFWVQFSIFQISVLYFLFYSFFIVLHAWLGMCVLHILSVYLSRPLSLAELWTRCEWEYVIYVSVHLCNLVMSIFLFLLLLIDFSIIYVHVLAVQHVNSVLFFKMWSVFKMWSIQECGLVFAIFQFFNFQM